jgi:hypothetical protein
LFVWPPLCSRPSLTVQWARPLARRLGQAGISHQGLWPESGGDVFVLTCQSDLGVFEKRS